MSHAAPSLVTLAAAFLLAGCATATGSSANDLPRHHFDEEEIRESGATTAWNALRFLVPNFGFYEDRRTGQPAKINRRGRSSIHLERFPLVVVDGARISDIVTLNAIPADQLRSIDVIGAVEATNLYGSNAGDGAILIATKR